MQWSHDNTKNDATVNIIQLHNISCFVAIISYHILRKNSEIIDFSCTDSLIHSFDLLNPLKLKVYLRNICDFYEYDIIEKYVNRCIT